MFGQNATMDKNGFRKWIKAIGIFPDLADDAPIEHLFRSYDRNRYAFFFLLSVQSL